MSELLSRVEPTELFEARESSWNVLQLAICQEHVPQLLGQVLKPALKHAVAFKLEAGEPR